LRWDSHFWWQRKENGPSNGIAVGMSRGRDMNVFSSMSAVICTRVVTSVVCTAGKEDGGAYCMWVAVGEVDRNGASDGLAI